MTIVCQCLHIIIIIRVTHSSVTQFAEYKLQRYNDINEHRYNLHIRVLYIINL